MIDFCVLGSGISGSTIANLLSKKNSVEIIDKAKGVGGRASNKKINKSISFDHGLQYFSPKGIKFKKYLELLVKKKILKDWDGNHIDFTFKTKKFDKKIIGVKGNNDLVKYLLKNIKKNLDEKITYIKFTKNHWEISSNKKKFKAKNIIVTFPYPQTIKLARRYLKNSFLKHQIKMTPNLTLLVVQKRKKPMAISSIRLKNNIISWISHENSKKRFSNKNGFWTIQTSEVFSKKVINKFKSEKNYYSSQILKEFSKILDLNYKNLKVFKIHGWKYSYNKTEINQNFYWCKKFKLGICGDWFIGPNAEAGWKSANALYNEIKKTRQI